MEEMKLNLQLFADGGEGGSAGGEAAPGSETGVTQGDAAPETGSSRRRKENPLAHVRYGIDRSGEGAAQEPEAPEAEREPEDRAAKWKALKEEYAQEYGSDVQTVIRERFRNQQDAQAQLESLRPMLAAMSQRMGIQDASDLQAISNAYLNDNSLYEQEAEEQGLPVETVKELHQLQADSNALQQLRQESADRQIFEGHLQKLMQQGEAMKATFPTFDLRAELQNPQFARLTSPSVNLSVEEAYWLCHRNELQPAAMAAGVQVATQRLSNAIQAGQRRPSENGTARGAAVETKTDPTKLTRADREEIRRRVARGEKIYV